MREILYSGLLLKYVEECREEWLSTSSGYKTEAYCSSEMLENFFQTVRSDIQEDTLHLLGTHTHSLTDALVTFRNVC
jgi:hypothetical protein